MPFGDPWTDPQRQLAQLLYGVWSQRGYQWPTYAWVKHTMYARWQLDATEILASFPVLGEVSPHTAFYSDVAYHQSTLPQPDTRVCLTVHGLWRVTDGARTDPARVFLALLEYAGQARLTANLDPFKFEDVRITSNQFQKDRMGPDNGQVVAALYRMVGTEPYAVTGLAGNGQQDPSGPWTMLVAPQAIAFGKGVTMPEYTTKVEALLAPQRAPLPRVAASPLGLLEALHYLDITWQRHCRRPLVQVSNPAAVGTLTFDISGEAEFQARVSALADLLKALQTHSVSGIDGVALVRLAAYLTEHLDADDANAAKASIQILTHIMNIRHGQQHSSAAPDALEAWRALRLVYPPRDWNIAWQQIRSAATDAVMDLRDRVEALPPDGCSEHQRPPGRTPSKGSQRPSRPRR